MSDQTRLLDVNVLVALSLPAHVDGGAAHGWLSGLREPGSWATCPLTELSFVRLISNPAVVGAPQSASVALDLLHAIRELPGHRFFADPTSLAHATIDLIGLRGHQQVADFHLVNLAAACGAVLSTFDRRIEASLAPADRHLVEVIPPL